ncbi:MAG: zf-HC2 domain-containing protein [Oscillospiraceae bacterium]|nr:zf-HC2 domain-containing protein [Oscillospiraceae bacterium]
MKTPCEIIRDLLPLYADDVCSPASRETVDEHLRECPACAEYLRQLRAGELESGLQEEKDQVLRHQAKRFKRRSELVGTVIAGVFMVPILVSLIVNLASGRVLGWFFIVAAAMIVAASLIVVPLLVPEDRLFWTFCAFSASLLLLLGVCCLYTRGDWFPVAGSAVLFGLAVLGLPFAIRAKPLRKWVGERNKALLVIAVDVILFANMMNMITLHSKGFLYSAGLGLVCALGLGFLAAAGLGEEKDK